jgi:hypothetical protein
MSNEELLLRERWQAMLAMKQEEKEWAKLDDNDASMWVFLAVGATILCLWLLWIAQ